MCGRYYYTCISEDEKLNAVNKYMEKNYPGAYKTGEIFPGDIVPAVIDRQGKIVAVPAGFGFPGYQDNKLIINARVETSPEHLDELVREVLLDAIGGQYTDEILAWRYLQPGRPNPTHRIV